ncbi:MAG: protein kinase [Gemmatimonadota bacterium]
MTDISAALDHFLEGRYTLERELGRGGMAYVYLAQDLKHRRPVAIKVLRPELSAALGAERFLREIELTARLSHPRILAIHDSGTAGDLLYYVMPYVAGESLRARMDRERQLPVDDAVALTAAICSALEYAHSHGVVHRDIKPENILLADGEVLVADFGIARTLSAADDEQLTQTGLAIGTPAYMSPEQAAGESAIDGRSDVFALGCVLFEMLVGEAPFRGPSSQAIAARRALEPMPSICLVRRGVPVAIERAVRKALEKAPADRFPTARAFAEALTKAATEPPTSEHPAPARRRSRTVMAAALAALLLGGVAVTTYKLTHRLSSSRAAGSGASNGGLAVLAFDNLSSVAGDSILSRGLAAELATELRKVPGLRVAAPAAAFSFRGTAVSLDSIGRALDVRRLVTGTLRRTSTGDSIRIDAQLLDAANGSQEWTGHYEAKGSLSFALQDSIVLAIVTALQGRIAERTRQLVVNHGTTDVAAQEAYFRGRLILASRQHLDEALKSFDEAIRRDSAYANAWAGRGDVYAFMSFFCCLEPNDGLPVAKAAVLRALELDPTSAEAHTSLAIILQQGERNDVTARAQLDTALALDSSYADTHLFLAWSHALRDEFPQAIAEAQKALRLSPRSVIISMRLGSMYYFAHNYDAAAAQFRRTLELGPAAAAAHTLLAYVYVQQKRCDAALAETAAGIRAGAITLAPPGYIYAVCNRRPEAQRMLAELLEQSRGETRVPAWYIAFLYLGLGDRDKFFSWFERSANAHEPGSYLMDPVFDSVREDPRFKALGAWILPPAGT